MKRIALLLTVLGILCVAVGQVQAHDHHYRGGWHGNYGVAVVRPHVWVAPPVVIAPPPPPVMAYPPPYRYRYYAPVQRGGFYFGGRGVSVGVDW